MTSAAGNVSSHSRREVAKAILRRRAGGRTVELADLLAPDHFPASERATARLACEVFAQPAEKGADCLAMIYGLRGAGSLRPWLLRETTNPADLARQDFEPEFGAAWRQEWERRQGEAFLMLEARIGRDWPHVLATRIALEERAQASSEKGGFRSQC